MTVAYDGRRDMIGGNLDSAEEWLRSWTAQADARAQAAMLMSERVADLSSTVTVADGAITVTVAGSGVLTGLVLDDRVQRMSGRDLAGQIMRAVAKAQAGLNEQVATVVAETVGPASETGQAVLGSFERRFPAVSDEPEGNREGEAGRRG